MKSDEAVTSMNLRHSSVDIFARLSTRPTAKRLILSVLSQPNMSTLPIQQLVAWGILFDQKPAAVRVTAGRLVNEAVLEKTGRGLYTIGSGGLALKNKARTWTTALNKIRDWQGGWFVVYTAHLGKAIRRNVRARERAFRLYGFKELVDGLWVRPDNLTDSAAEIYASLCQLGLEPRAVLLQSDRLHQCDLKDPLSLWSGDDLNTGYETAITLLQESRKRLEGETLHRVTRETFIIGEHVIRQINADPLLPAEHINASKREGMVQAMRHYSEFCHPYWVEFLGAST